MKHPEDTSSAFTRINSLVVAAIERYSASSDELGTVVYFFVFQEIDEPPMLRRYPVRERWVSGQAPQSASQYARIMRS